MEEKEKAKHKPEHILSEVMGFDEHDLEANREGQLSERQYDQLLGERSSWMGCLVIAGAGIGIVLLYFMIFVLLDDNPPAARAILAIIGLLIGIGIFGFAYYRWSRMGRELVGREVASVEGRVQLLIMGKDSYKIRIGEVGLKVTSSVFLAFKNGDPYVLYFTPETRKLMSAEWLRD